MGAERYSRGRLGAALGDDCLRRERLRGHLRGFAALRETFKRPLRREAGAVRGKPQAIFAAGLLRSKDTNFAY